MSKPLAVVLFSGGGGACIGLRNAGYHTIGVEYEPAIADVARSNGLETITADVTQIDPLDVCSGTVDLLQASPVCKSFSQANTSGEEHALDIASAHALVRFLRTYMPRVFVLENVYPYRKSKSFAIIRAGLRDLGYSFDYWNLNSADYGVPQTRRRLIGIGFRDGRTVSKPIATHCEPKLLERSADQLSLFDEPKLLPWRGWYAAIEDLVPELPDSELAPWQIERLPAELRETMLVPGGNKGAPVRPSGAPSFTITSSSNSSTGIRAFVLDGQTNDNGETVTIRDGSEPMYTLSASMDKRPARALLVPGGNASSFSLREASEPARTVGDVDRLGNAPRAILVHPTDMRTMPMTMARGRVVKLTPRCLARFQAFPDDYILPSSNSLACTIIGNAVPPTIMEAVEYVARNTN